MATNRHDTLDPALLRPGRLDRKIEFPMPDRRQKRLIFSTITAKMNLSEEVDLEDCILTSIILLRTSVSVGIIQQNSLGAEGGVLISGVAFLHFPDYAYCLD